jgi:hypothetical protein
LTVRLLSRCCWKLCHLRFRNFIYIEYRFSIRTIHFQRFQNQKHMNDFNKYHLEKIEREHPEKVIKINGPMPETWKKAILEKQKWAEEVRSRGKIDLTKLEQKNIDRAISNPPLSTH